jgi:hypothetical protein
MKWWICLICDWWSLLEVVTVRDEYKWTYMGRTPLIADSSAVTLETATPATTSYLSASQSSNSMCSSCPTPSPVYTRRTSIAVRVVPVDTPLDFVDGRPINHRQPVQREGLAEARGHGACTIRFRQKGSEGRTVRCVLPRSKAGRQENRERGRDRQCDMEGAIERQDKVI